MITGNTLINLGFKPGSWFKEAIKHCNENKLSDEGLLVYLDAVCPKLLPTIQPKQSSVAYHFNIVAENEEEKSNLSSVIRTMDEVMKTPTVVNGAIMPDACPTGEIGQIPVGGIVVAKNAIHPSMHSADICCSVMATNFGNINPKNILDAAHSIAHFGPGGRRDNKFELPLWLETKIMSNPFLNSQKSLELAKTHLGTSGDGNHFIYVGERGKGIIRSTYIVTHYGSRGFGALLYKKGMECAEKFRLQISPNTLKRNAWIPFDSQEGKDYWEALQIVRDWTELNHSLLHEEVGKIAQKASLNSFWNEHNFVFKDGDLFYHAKGATPLDDKFVPDSYQGLRLIPLNMSEPILIVKGKTTETNLGFAPHGAGRNVSRSEHSRNNATKTKEEIFKEETKGLDVRFFSNKIDISELPSAYKNAQNVKDQIVEFGLGEVVGEINPFGCLMAGHFEQPWKKK